MPINSGLWVKTVTTTKPPAYALNTLKENPMKKWLFISLLPLIGACTSPVALTGPDAAPTGAGTLNLTWLASNSMEVVLDGQRYVGEWTSIRCSTDACRGVYRNVPRIHRRHIRQGQAELVAQDGARMTCEWVSHLPEVQGTCTTQDGRKFLLEAKGAKPHQGAGDH